MINPTINIINGIYTAFLRLSASFRYSLSELILIKYFAIKNNIMFIIMKSRPYNDCVSNEFG